MPARSASYLALLLILGALLAPAGAFAQGSPFSPIPQAPPEPVPTVVPADDDDDGDLSRTQEILIGLAGFALLVGIGYAIVRDARNNAPVDDRRTDPVLGGLDDEEVSRRSGSRTPKQQRVKSNRTKAKAARQARKRNARRR